MLIIPNQYRERNKQWEVYTPNEVYNNIDLSIKLLGYEYEDLESLFALKGKINSPKVWREFRIIKSTTDLDVADRHRWWDDPMFMDKVFWVYQKPVRIKVNNVPRFFFALEMFECARVANLAFEKHGKPMFSSPFPPLLIPKENVENCWNETTNGYADNIRWRPDEVITQKQVDLEAKSEELLKEIKPVDFVELKESIDESIDRTKTKMGL